MRLTPAPVAETSAVQPAKAFAPMLVHEEGRTTVSSAVHPAKHPCGTETIEADDRSAVLSVVHPANTPSANAVVDDPEARAEGSAAKPKTRPSRDTVPSELVETEMKES